MPSYQVTDQNTGKKYRLTGDSPPTEQELNEMFSQKEPKKFGATLDNSPEAVGYYAGGKVTDWLAPHTSPEVAGGAGFIANVGVQSIPALIGAGAGEKIAKPVIQSAGKRIMQSALKPSTAARMSGKADRAITTLLEKGANVTEGGLNKLETLSAALKGQVDDIVNKSSGNIDKKRISTEIVKALKQARLQPNPNKDIRGVSSAWDEFASTNPREINIQLAQKLKEGGHKAVEESYGKLSRGREAGVKAINRGLRLGIEDVAPTVAPINKDLGNVINASKLVKNRVGGAANRDIGGLAWLANNPIAAATFMAGRSEPIKSALARLLYSGVSPAMPSLGAAMGGLIGHENNY